MSNNQFIPYDGIYMLNHSIGRPPVIVRTAIEQTFLDPWVSEGVDVWPAWLAGIESFRAALAALLHSEPGYFCPQTNLSSALTKILGSLPQQGRDTILLSEQDFPTIGFVAAQAQSMGYQLRYMPGDDNAWDANVWDKYLTEDVRFALVTHVQSNTGYQTPVREIAALSRQRGILSIIDIAQSAGVIPIDLQAWQADFVIGSCVKWLCGGPGAGYLWAHPDIVQLCKPNDVGWFSHASPFEFDIHNFRYADGVLRFWGGTPSVLPYVMATVGLQLLHTIGVHAIREHNIALSQAMIDVVPSDAMVSPTNDRHRGGTLVLNYGKRQAQLVAALNEASVQFDSRPLGLRISPHIYNSIAEIEVIKSCLPV